ncbi:unnamed protein product [Anisakis simplex]|uniref:Solute carrier family 35 member F6 (inferred by orthology to a human protein) n=1 Tax=Anisakis simplex TaxID=6269 RepID=A0A0M3KBN8_ANISI|nr:unnamed protein product [Anisakis simplex]
MCLASRCAGIIFTGMMSILFLRMRLEMYQWASMVPVVIGLVIIFVIDILFSEDFFIGDLFVITAQIVVALQMVAEQKLLADCDVPALFAVGLEGIFGFLILSILMIPISVYTPENALDAFEAMHDSGELVGALCLTVARLSKCLEFDPLIWNYSTAFFNFSGVLVTKYMSATTRMVLGSVCIIIVWPVSNRFFHSQFIPYQIIGFVFLVGGMFIYNDILLMPFVRKTNLYKRMFPKWAAELEASESEKE